MTLTRLPSCLRTVCTKAHSAPPVHPNAPSITPLQRSLVRRIRFNGPLTVADYMRECLTHPQHGYYTTQEKVLGARGDFITAPEASQVFGELVGLWAASVTTGRSFRLIELGPGSGKLMRDALRALQAVDQLPSRVDLVEASPVLQAAQSTALNDVSIPVYWHKSVQSALRACDKTAPVILGQEFLDALPLHVLHSCAGGWRERLVDVHDKSDDLRFALAPCPTPASTAGAAALSRWGAPKPKDGDVAEICLEGIAVVETVASSIADHGCGAALFVDYARRDDKMIGRGNSLRAIRKHKFAPVLEAPGECDLTADVNFEHIKQAVKMLKTPVAVHGPVTQRELLLSLGIAHRFRQLAVSVIDDTGSTDEEKDEALATLQMNYERLTGVEEMGEIYMALAITAADAGVPDGFSRA